MMKYSQFKFVETAYGGVNKRNNIAKISEIRLPPEPTDCFKTIFRFKEEYISYWESNNYSSSGFRGDCYSDFIPIDIDHKDLNQALVITRNFIQWLYCELDVPLEAIETFFSGFKGFHVHIPTSLLGEVEPSDNLPQRFRSLISSLGDWGFDLSIYQSSRLWRLENSINSNTNLVKIRLSPSELLSLSYKEIKNIAKAPRELDSIIDYDDWFYSDGLVQLWKKTSTNRQPILIEGKQVKNENLDFLNRGVPEGIRNNTLFSYGKKLKILGYLQNEAINLLSAWNNKNLPPLTESELKRTIKSVYSFTITDTHNTSFFGYLRTDPIYKNLNAKQRDIYLQVLCRINTKKKDWYWNGVYYECDPGEMIFSYRKFPNYCASNVSIKNVRTTFKMLEDLEIIKITHLGKKRGSKLKVLVSTGTLNGTPQHRDKNN